MGSITDLSVFRAAGELLSRFNFANKAGVTFDGKRDLYSVLGYELTITPEMMRSRYERGGITARIVRAYPDATWRGAIELIEDEDPEVTTDFEAQWIELQKRLKIWSVFARADILAGLGRYSVVLYGLPGDLETPVSDSFAADDLVYLQTYGEEDMTVVKFDEDFESERFGLPLEYTLKRTGRKTGNAAAGMSRRVHFSRVLHIAHNILDDRVYGSPLLPIVWNYLNDLDKIAGGGAEAFWRRANQGLFFKADKDLQLDPADAEKIKDEAELFVHNMRRVMAVRGMEITQLGSDVANTMSPIDAAITLIAGATGIPKRILVGSERGELASTQDRENWEQRIRDRRSDFAEPVIVRPFVDFLSEHGALPPRLTEAEAAANAAKKEAGEEAERLADEEDEDALNVETEEESGVPAGLAASDEENEEDEDDEEDDEEDDKEDDEEDEDDEVDPALDVIGDSDEERDYEVRWPDIEALTKSEQAHVAETWTKLNSQMGETVITAAEVRDLVLRLEPLPEDEIEIEVEPPPPPPMIVGPDGVPVPVQLPPAEDEELEDDLDASEKPKGRPRFPPKGRGARGRAKGRAVHDAADASRAKIGRAIERVVTLAQAEVSLSTLEEVVSRRQASEVEAMFDTARHRLTELARELLEPVLLEVLQRAGNNAARAAVIAGTFKTAAGKTKITIKFDPKFKTAVEWAKRRAAELVTNISSESRLAVRAVIHDVLNKGVTPSVASRLIRDAVGLTVEQSEAVLHMRERLLAQEVAVESITRKTDAYAERLLRQRAETISRTETIAAANEGQRQLWLQAVDQGQLDADSKRVWITTLDDRSCPECEELDGEVAPLDAPFPGGVMSPPAHPNCRCATGISS